MNETIREITSAETYPMRQKVMWPNMPTSFIILPNDAKGIHFGLFKNEILISVASLFIENNIVQFRKLATDQKEQRKGYGTLLLSHLIRFSKQKKLTKIWCNARIDKQEFYMGFGFTPTDNRFTRAEIDYVVMEKLLLK
jgi:predicted GNAT family N-acyltransferase